MRNHELDIILLGMEVYGLRIGDIAALVRCGTGTVYRARGGMNQRPSTVRAFLTAADRLAEQGMMVREAGRLALEHIPPEYVEKVDERWGFVAPYRDEILASLSRRDHVRVHE